MSTSNAAKPALRILSSAVALTASIVGAGFASGREIYDFFSLHGRWAPLFMALSALLMGLGAARLLYLCRARGVDTLDGLVRTALPRFHGLVTGFFGLLLLATAAAMCAGLRELLARHLPGPWPMIVSAMAALALSVLCQRKLSALSVFGALLLPCMLVFYAMQRIDLPPVSLRAAHELPRLAISYAGLNVAIALGVIPPLSRRVERGHALPVGLLCAALLCLLLLTAHRALAPGASAYGMLALPAAAMAADLGRVGEALFNTVLACAILSTLLGTLRGLGDMLRGLRQHAPYWLAAVLGYCLSLLGFRAIVGGLYPALGLVSAALLIALMALPERGKGRGEGSRARHRGDRGDGPRSRRAGRSANPPDHAASPEAPPACPISRPTPPRS